MAKCDILVENYIPGSLKKYDMDYETLRKINPGLIYASITGYGQTGPYSQRAGYDVMVEAEFGLMHITGDRDGPPVKVGVAVTDLTTGLYTSNSIMAALLARAKTGRGQHIDIALSDCQTATLANIASSCLVSGKKDSGRWGTAHRKFVTSPHASWAIIILTLRKPIQLQSSRTSLSRPRTAIFYSAEATTGSLGSCATALGGQSGSRTPSTPSMPYAWPTAPNSRQPSRSSPRSGRPVNGSKPLRGVACRMPPSTTCRAL